MLSNSDINTLKKAGYDIHQIKEDIVGNKNVSKYDLFKNSEGDIFVKLKGGNSSGEPTNINIKDIRKNL